MKKSGLILLTMLWFSGIIQSQEPVVLWTKIFGGSKQDDCNACIQTYDGGYMVVGASASFTPGKNFDAYLIRTDSIGDTIWTKTYGGSSSDEARAIQQTSDSGFIIVGNTTSKGAGGCDIYLIRTNVQGDTLWTKTYGGAKNDSGYSFTQLGDSGFVVVGKTESYGAGKYDIYLIRTDKNGDSLWTKTYGTIDHDVGRCVLYDSNKIYITGVMDSSIWPHLVMIGTDYSGVRKFTSVLGDWVSVNTSFQWASDSGFMVGSVIRYSEFCHGDLWRTGSNGEFHWKKDFSFWHTFYFIPSFAKGYVITGSLCSRESRLLRVDENGETLWEKQIQFPDTTLFIGPVSVLQIRDSGFVVAGMLGEKYEQIYPDSTRNIYLIRTSAETSVKIKDKKPANVLKNNLISVVYDKIHALVRIQFSLQQQVKVTVKAYDIKGCLVSVIADNIHPAGQHITYWNTNNYSSKNIASGIYFIKVSTDTFTVSKKISLIR